MQFLSPKIRFWKELQRKPFSLQGKERYFGGTDEELFVISFFVFELRKDVCVVLAFDTPFSTLYSLFIVSRNSEAKSSPSVPPYCCCVPLKCKVAMLTIVQGKIFGE